MTANNPAGADEPGDRLTPGERVACLMGIMFGAFITWFVVIIAETFHG